MKGTKVVYCACMCIYLHTGINMHIHIHIHIRLSKIIDLGLYTHAESASRSGKGSV